MQPSKTTSLFKVTTAVVSTIAVLHIAIWACCTILGIAAIWIRSQEGQSVISFLGLTGLPVWASIPFPICGILSIMSDKTNRLKLIAWFMNLSIASAIGSLAIAIYCGLAVADESGNTTNAKQLIVGAVTTFVAFLELVNSTISFVICFNAIGPRCCNTKLRARENGGFHSSRVAPGDDLEPGHVAVMALPAKQAAELFLSMYRPGNTHSQFHHSAFEEALFANTGMEGHYGRYGSPPDEHRRHRKRARRSRSRLQSPENLAKRSDETESDEARRPKSRQTAAPHLSSDHEEKQPTTSETLRTKSPSPQHVRSSSPTKVP